MLFEKLQLDGILPRSASILGDRTRAALASSLPAGMRTVRAPVEMAAVSSAGRQFSRRSPIVRRMERGGHLTIAGEQADASDRPVFEGRHDILVDAPSDAGAVTTSWGESARIRISGADTLHTLAMLDYRAPANFGPPRHLHRNDDEILLVESGELVLWTPEGCASAKAGDVLYLPRCMPHAWRACGAEGVHLQITVSPGEFETYLPGIARRRLTIGDRNDILAVASDAGMEILGDPLRDEEVAAILRGDDIP